MAANETLELFLSSGIDKRRAEETLKNPALTETLKSVINEVDASNFSLLQQNLLQNLLLTLFITARVLVLAHS